MTTISFTIYNTGIHKNHTRKPKNRLYTSQKQPKIQYKPSKNPTITILKNPISHLALLSRPYTAFLFHPTNNT